MPRLTVSQRLRRRLRALVKPWGTKAALARYTQSPGGAQLTPQELSMFLGGESKRRVLTLDDLDDIAAFFRLSIGELIDETKAGDLSGDEQRLVYAFRALPAPTREHFLALIEAASVHARIISKPL